jgi:hypothetical protein
VVWFREDQVMSSDDSSASDTRLPEVGEVFRLAKDMGDIPTRLYAVTEVGWLVTLCRVGQNEDGDYCTTGRTCKVTFDEFARFEPEFLILPI